jgi:tetratricopeptide (TPR) repeat protein
VSDPEPTGAPERQPDIPSSALDHAGQQAPVVLVPVAREDFDRRRRRVIWTWVGAVALVAGAGAWLHKRSVDPIRAQEAFDAGERLVRIARYEQAILSFNQAIALNGGFAQAYLLRGRANMGLSRPAEAVADFSRVIELRPGDPRALLERGTARLDLREFDAALADFDQAIRLQPDLAEAHNLRGIALRSKGDLNGALEAANRAVSLAPVMNHYYERAATLQLLERHAEAVEDLTRVIEFEPQSAQAYFARAKSLRAMGDEAGADRDHRTGRIMDSR